MRYIFKISCVAAVLFAAYSQCGYAAENGSNLKVAFAIDGRLGGEDMSPAEVRLAARKLESTLSNDLGEILGLRNFDKDALAKIKTDKEKWAVLTGGGIDDVRKILSESGLDLLLRVYFRTAPAYRIKNPQGEDTFLGTASITLEAIGMNTGEKAVMAWSPPMGMLETGKGDTGKLHPPQKGEDEFEAGMAALKYAGRELCQSVKASGEFAKLGEKDNSGQSAPGGPRVIFTMTGDIRGADIAQADQRVGASRLEATLSNKLKNAIGIRNFDDAILKKIKSDAEQWAALQGGGVDEVQAVLKKHGLDALVRVYYRTAPAYRKKDPNGNTMFSGTASIMTEIVSLSTGEKGIVVESPSMGTQEHPARRALDDFDASMAALDYATDTLVQRVVASDASKALASKSSEPSATADLSGGRIMFVLDGIVKGKDISRTEQKVGAMRLEASLDRELRAALGIRNFDDTVLSKIRKDAEQWAVLLGGGVDEIRGVLDKHNVDGMVRVYYRAKSRFKDKDDDGNAIHTATATIIAELINRKTGEKAKIYESPEMGSDQTPATSALDGFDACMEALAFASRSMVGNIKSDQNAPSFMKSSAKPAQIVKPVAKTNTGLPTFAVLWVKPSAKLKPWFTRRSSRPGASKKKRMQIKEFIEHVKKTGSIGIEVAHYLVQGMAASGKFMPVEESAGAREDIAEIKNKLLEYRMAGWVGERLPFSNPVKVAQAVGAEYVVTAEVGPIAEKTSGFSAAVVSKGNIEAVAEVVVTVTNVASGKSSSYTGTGSFNKSGYGTVMMFDPSAMQFDKMLLSGAIKEAIYNAAAKAGE